ncbi:MAG: porin family protein [Deltaproteobacteria bacterium]|nr:porin family protein [Deltaproteobacteria bacterium]
MLKRFSCVITLCLLILASFSSMAYADNGFYAGAQLGYAVLTSDAASEMDDGVSLGIFGGYMISEDISLEATAAFSRHDDEPKKCGDHSLDVISVLFGPRFIYYFKDMRVYMDAGFGIYNCDYKYRPELLPGYPRDENDFESGIYGGIGMDFPISGRIHVGLDLKYHHVFDNELLDGDMLTPVFRIEVAL